MLEERVQGLEREMVGLKERLARMEREQGVTTPVRPARTPKPEPGVSYAWPEQAKPAPRPPAPAPRAPERRPVAAPKPAPKPRPTVDLEDLLGGRVLAWLGGAAVAIGLAFLMALAISSGWIGEGARTVIAGVAAAALIGVGIWLHEKRGRTDAALASLSAGIASMFGVAAVATTVYHLIPTGAGLVMAIATGALATALAVRWESQGIAALGLVGAMLAPAVGGGFGEGPAVVVLFVAAASAVAVLLSQGWRWLSYGVVLISLPQWVMFLVDNHDVTLEIVAVAIGFGILGAVAALGHEMRDRPERMSASSAFLLVVNALTVGTAGWFALAAASGRPAANAWIWALGAAHVGVALWASRRQELARDLSLLLFGAGTVIADVAFALSFQGPVRSIGWVLTGVAFAALARHQRENGVETSLVSVGLGGHLALALVQALSLDATPELIGNAATAPSLAAAGALIALAAGCFASGRLADDSDGRLRSALDAVGLAVLGYLTVIALDNLPLVLALAAEGVALAAIARREKDEVAAWGALGAIALAGAFALGIAPPTALAGSLDDPLGALAALGAVAVACGLTARLIEVERGELGRLIDSVGLVVVGYLALVELDGVVLVAALSAGGLLLVLWWRAQDELVGFGAAAVALTFAAGFALELAPPSALGYGLGEPLAGAGALAALIAATGGAALLAPSREMRPWLVGAASLTALYLASVLVVTPFQPDGAAAQAAVFELPVRQQGQALLSGMWALVGLGGLVVGLTRDVRALRLAALGLLLVAVGKVFTYDLATLASVYRVASFVALGVLLLVAAFAWQRVRPRALPDMREAPEGIR